MSIRGLYLLGFAVLLAVQSGCCCGGIWPCGKNYCGSQCGQLYWHEWFSIPPNCCDPCTCCGNHAGTTNPYVRNSMPPMGRPWNWTPDMAAAYAGLPTEGGPPPGTMPAGDMVPPSQLRAPGTVPPAARNMSPAEANQLRRANYQGQVDSPGSFRTLGRARRLSDLFHN